MLVGFANANDYGDHEVGSLHPVMGIENRQYLAGGDRECLCLLLDEGDESWYPVIYPVELYEVVDPRLPQGWSASFGATDQSMGIRMVSFEEAVADPNFFGRLVDADELPAEQGERMISIYRKRVHEVKELSKDFYSELKNGTM
jgi:hypothetical protein